MYRKHQQVHTTQQTSYGLDGRVSILGSDGRLSSTIQTFIQTGPRVPLAGKKRWRRDTQHSVPSAGKIRRFTGAPLHALNDTFIRIYEIQETEDNDSTLYILHRKHGLLPLEGPICESCTGYTTAVHCDGHTEHMTTVCGQKAEILMLNLAVHTVTTKLERVKLVSYFCTTQIQRYHCQYSFPELHFVW